MKLLTLAAAASRLGWDYRFVTTLEAAGTIADGVLTGDLIVTGTGDPSITSSDLAHPALFLEWASALRDAGIQRVDGRLVGDDDAFDDEGPGPGWAWDYLEAGYAAPAGALSYQENVVSLRVTPGAREGAVAMVAAGPAGNSLRIVDDVLTGPPGSSVALTIARAPGSTRVVVAGQVPAGGTPVTRVVTVPNPTLFFVGAMRDALAARGIVIARGAWDVDDLNGQVADGPRTMVARRESAPLSSLASRLMKDSQNFYGEMILKAVGRAADRPGTTAAGRDAARDALAALGIASDSYVMHDGSGLSRYDYVTADAIVTLLAAIWRDDGMREPFLASLPVAGRDGTLSERMRDPALAGRVQAKTGSIANMRALSGYLITAAGERLVFSMIANHFTAPTRDVDAVMEAILRRIAGTTSSPGPRNPRLAIILP
jgi:D-alanyl-D-alanine carboxypeptidase/D-alanyl-D-alanine-endopeptidase (penicillin-binding protein 4)